MNKELIEKMIDEARRAAGNALCAYSGVPMGAALLVAVDGGTMIWTGCNIEPAAMNLTLDAGEVALAKALSEGHSQFVAIAFWSEKVAPIPTGAFLQFAGDFNVGMDIIVATDETYSLHKLHDLLPIRRVHSEVE